MANPMLVMFTAKSSFGFSPVHHAVGIMAKTQNTLQACSCHHNRRHGDDMIEYFAAAHSLVHGQIVS